MAPMILQVCVGGGGGGGWYQDNREKLVNCNIYNCAKVLERNLVFLPEILEDIKV